MEYRALGRTGVQVSALCLGTMNFGARTGQTDSQRIIARAVETGINFIDTANIYSGGESERIVGTAIGDIAGRDQLIIATKVFNPTGSGANDRGLSRMHIIRECENSLRRLNTDYIDLYQLHRADFRIPPDETLRALDDLVRHGKVRYIGTSTFPAWKVMEYLSESRASNLTRLVSEQPPYNLLDRRIENELVPLARDHGIAIIPWSPLAQGVLAGRYPSNTDFASDSRAAVHNPVWNERITEAGRKVGARLMEYAAERGTTAADIALTWVKDQPGITAPIVGPRTMEHLEVALAIADNHLNDEDRKFIDTLVPPGSAVSNFHNNSGWMKMSVSG